MPTLTETFLNASGAPLADLTVLFRSTGSPVAVSTGLGSLSVIPATTDETGALTVTLVPGTYRVEWQSAAARNLLDIDVPEEGGPYTVGSLAAMLRLALSERIIAWTVAESFAMDALTYDGLGILSGATVTWPDGASGTLTVLTVNDDWLVPDSFRITHVQDGVTITVTQDPVTRDEDGNVTEQPTPTAE